MRVYTACEGLVAEYISQNVSNFTEFSRQAAGILKQIWEWEMTYYKI